MAERLNSRDLVIELEELTDEDEPLNVHDNNRREALAELLTELRDNCDEEPENGIQLIPADDFTNYAQEYADDCGYMGLKVAVENYNLYSSGINIETVTDRWPFNHIDWEAAADELKQDWYGVEFDGRIYLAR